MISTEHWLVHDHTTLEVMLTNIHQMADNKDWKGIEQQLSVFISQVDFHIGQEEEVLFPAFVSRAEHLVQPVTALKKEHDLINEVVREVISSVANRDIDCLRDTFSYLETLMNSHHEKEELFVLPMAGHILYDEREALSGRLNAFKGPRNKRDWGLD